MTGRRSSLLGRVERRFTHAMPMSVVMAMKAITHPRRGIRRGLCVIAVPSNDVERRIDDDPDAIDEVPV